jgi:drug/metabolite transporter (DMT)-like permease
MPRQWPGYRHPAAARVCDEKGVAGFAQASWRDPRRRGRAAGRANLYIALATGSLVHRALSIPLPAMDRSPRDPATDAGLLVLAVIWGVNFSVVKAVLGHLDPLALNALRFPIAAAALWLVIRSLGSRRVDPEDRLRLLLLGLLGNVVYQLAFIIGIDRTLAGNASLLLATTPVWTVLLSVARGHERLTPLVGTGALLTLVGMVLVVMGSGQEVGLGTTTLAGDALMALAAVLWATYTVGSSRLVQKYGPIRVTTWTLWVGTPVLVLMAVPELAETNWTALPLAAWGGVMYSGVQRIGNSKTAVYSNLVPVVALITAWIWLGEVPTAAQLSGAVVILGGIWLARRGA